MPKKPRQGRNNLHTCTYEEVVKHALSQQQQQQCHASCSTLLDRSVASCRAAMSSSSRSPGLRLLSAHELAGWLARCRAGRQGHPLVVSESQQAGRVHSSVTAFFPLGVHGRYSMPVQALASLQSSHALQSFRSKLASSQAGRQRSARTLMESGCRPAVPASGHHSLSLVWHEPI